MMSLVKRFFTKAVTIKRDAKQRYIYDALESWVCHIVLLRSNNMLQVKQLTSKTVPVGLRCSELL